MDAVTANAIPSRPPAGGRADSWTLPALVAGATLVTIGLTWDISWHVTIGRDTFWTPAHLAIYLGGATGGLICGWLAVRTTYFASAAERAASVGFWGGRAPLGVWLAIWGAVAMLTSAPFDNWWHNAYGLDVKILSPPHVLLFLGILGLRVGTWLLLLREQNRPGGSAAAPWLFCWIGGLVTGGSIGLMLTQIWPNRQHSSGYFLLISVMLPFFLCMVGEASKLKWGATIAMGGNMLLGCAMLWILPLFPAVPKLGPIYNPVTHMVPGPFPQWEIVPAILADLLRQRLGSRAGWRYAAIFAGVFSVLFLITFLPVQWEFSKFLMTPAANNWFFGGGRMWGYNAVPGPGWREFFPDEAGWTLPSVAAALLAAVISAFAGVRLGRWMLRIQR